MKRIVFILLVLLLIPCVSADTVLLYAANDGYLEQYNAGDTWANLRNGAGTTATDGYTGPYPVFLQAFTSSDTYVQMHRYALNFTKPNLGAGYTINSAKIRMSWYSSTRTLGGTNELAIVKGNPANGADFVAGDYNELNLASPTELATRVDFSGISSGNVNLTLNAAGISELAGSGGLTFYLLDGDELDNSFSGTWASGTYRTLRVLGVSYATQTSRPYMEYVYSASGGDTTPPSAISNLASTQTCSSINVTWTNPTSANFNYTYAQWGGSFYGNFTNTTTFNNFTGLSQGTTYSFNASTVSLAGVMNTTHWQNTSVTTNACIAPVSSFTPLGETTGTAPLTVQFNDTSTNTPTSWTWARNNLTHTTWAAFNTTRNASQSFVAGNWSVNLTVSNAYGSNISTQVSWVNVSAPPDVIPPKGITGLAATTINCTNMTFGWTNPTDSDYYRLQYRVNNSANFTLSNTTTSKLLEGLPESTSIEFSTQTEDLVGNINSTWVNATANTGACGAAPVSQFTPTGETLGVDSKSVSFTDTTLNSPTAWYWRFLNVTGNNTWTQFSTIQNPTYTFGIGNFRINLTSSNAYGVNISTQLTWVNVSSGVPPTPPSTPTATFPIPLCGRQDFYFYNMTADLTGYRMLKNIPELDSQKQITSASVTSASGEVTLGTWVSPAFTTDTSLAQGSWDFRNYFTTSNSAGITRSQIRVFNLSSSGVKTFFWYGNAIISDIDKTTIPSTYELSYARRNYTTFNAGDRLGVQINVSTDSASSRTVTMDLAGNTNASMFSNAYWVCPVNNSVTKYFTVYIWKRIE
jgi:PKD repeat protein